MDRQHVSGLGSARMGRRRIIALLGGMVLNGPLAVHAQQSAVPLVGYVSGRTRAGEDAYMPAVLRGFAESGFVDGQTMIFQARWAEANMTESRYWRPIWSRVGPRC